MEIEKSGEDRGEQDEMSTTSGSAISDPAPLALVDRLNIECLDTLLHRHHNSKRAPNPVTEGEMLLNPRDHHKHI